ncbi:MAG TPA: family 43 glycosylhydrolase [Nocardioides sp.]|nr:family 43 glycosylhydrolase [Nocardioides sp.]
MTPITSRIALRSVRRAALCAATLVALTGAGLALPPTGAAAADGPPVPALHYAFDETAGTTIADDSGNGYDGTIAGAGARFSDGQLTLPGGSSGSGAAYVSVPNAPFVGHEDVTISMWLQNTTGSGNYAAAYAGNQATANGYWLSDPANPSGYVKSVVTSATVASPSSSPWSTEVGAGSTGAATSGHASTSSMALYTTVIDGTGGTIVNYLDGQQILSSSTTASLADYGDASSLVAYLGKSPYADKFFSGVVDDYGVYDSALSATDVATLYQGHLLDQLQSSGVVLAGTSSALPSLDGLITGWTSTDDAVTIGADGFTATIAAGAPGTVTLHAHVGDNSYPIQVTLVAAPLAIPAVISGDLPSSVNGHAVAWDDGQGGAVVAADGSVARPATGSVSVHLTATVAGYDAPVTADAKVVDDGGAVASYTKRVTTTNGTRSDILAYADDRRADALYVSARTAGDDSWHSLNRDQAIAYVDWDGTQAAHPNNQMGSPSLFRDAHDDLGLVASQNNATGDVYVWSSDGTTFADQRLVTVSTDKVVTDPVITWDAASSTYAVSWTDGSGGGHLTRLTDLTPAATPSAPIDATPTSRGISATDGLPSFAQDVASFSMSRAEFTAFDNAYVDLHNTGVSVPGTTVANGSALTAAKLPAQATMSYNDGSTKNLDVSWSPSDIAAIDTTVPGTYAVTGTVQQDDFAYPFIKERADPDVVYNPDDGYYYATGSYYPTMVPGTAGNVFDTNGNEYSAVQTAGTSYRAIGLRRAKTIAGLEGAAESVVVAAGSTAMTGYSPYIWAPELHKINGTWYLLVGMRSGPSTNFPDSTVLIPFTGTDADVAAGRLMDASYWGAPVKLTSSPYAWDVTYFQRQENGVTQGYYVLPNATIPMSFQIVKARMGAGVVPLFDGPSTTIYRSTKPWQYGKDSYTETDEGTSDHDVIEAPFVMSYGGTTYLTFSAGTVDKYYSLGVMRAADDADLTDPSNWTVDDYPLLDSYDTLGGRIGGEAQAGPGHDALIQDAAGNLALVYHARPYPDPHGSAPGAGGLYDPDRSTAIKAVNVRANGDLDLSMTADQEVAPQNRTVTATVTVSPAPVVPKKTSRTVIRVDLHRLSLAIAKAHRTHARRVPLVIGLKVLAGGHAGVATGVVKVRVAGSLHTVRLRAGVASLTVRVALGRTYVIRASYTGTATVAASQSATSVRVRR